METIIFEHVSGLGYNRTKKVGTLLATKELVNGMQIVIIAASKFNPEIERSVHPISGNKIVKVQRFNNIAGRDVALDKAIQHAKKCHECGTVATSSWLPPMQLKEAFEYMLPEFVIRVSRYFPGTPIIIPVIKYKKSKSRTEVE